MPIAAGKSVMVGACNGIVCRLIAAAQGAARVTVVSAAFPTI